MNKAECKAAHKAAYNVLKADEKARKIYHDITMSDTPVTTSEQSLKIYHAMVHTTSDVYHQVIREIYAAACDAAEKAGWNVAALETPEKAAHKAAD